MLGIAIWPILVAWSVPACAQLPRPPEPPREFLQTDLAMTPVVGKTIDVTRGADLQAALDEARPGDEVVLQSGAVYTGNFVLPTKGDSDKWITIRTSDMAGIPPEGSRVEPRHAGAMPKIVDPTGEGAISTALGASHYRLIGLEIAASPDVETTRSLVKFGSTGNEQSTLDVVPHDLILDRVYIHGDPTRDCFRCVALNSARTSILDSHLVEAHHREHDAQAICGWNGPGPYKIVNNHLEGSGENIMFGGGDASIPDLVPRDIEFRYNYCFKPLSWKIDDPTYAGIPWAVKNLFELKNARRVLIEGNTFENNWVHAQNGTGILFTVRNQYGGSPWSAVQDITMINNRLRNSPTGFVVMGFDSPNKSQQTQRFLIQNNLFEGIERRGFLIISGSDDIEMDHNTFVPVNYSSFSMSGLGGHDDGSGEVIGMPCMRFKLTNNIMGFGLYGPGVDGGQNAFDEAFPGMTWEQNLFVGYGEGRAAMALNSASFPRGSLFEGAKTGDGASGDADWPAVGFADYAGANYRLTEASTYRGAGTDDKDLGADIDALEEALSRSRG